MRRTGRVSVLLLVALAGCRQLLGIDEAGQIADAPVDSEMITIDAPHDASVAPWGPPAFVPDTEGAYHPSLTSDLLELYVSRGNDIHVMKRLTPMAAWQPMMIIPELSSAAVETTPEISGDGLSLVFASDRPPATGMDLFITTRVDRTTPWSAPQRILELSSTGMDSAGGTSADQRRTTLSMQGLASFDLYVSQRASPFDPWGAPVQIPIVNTNSADQNPSLSGDGLTVYFASNRDGNLRLYEAAATDPVVRPISELNTLQADAPWVSADGRLIYFVVIQANLSRIAYATR